jgi:hypothetical protein
MMTAGERSELEVRVLRAVCARRDAALRAAVKMVARYSWTAPDHAVVYAAVRAALERGAAATTRESLSGLATRAGFPDLDWDLYFADVEQTDFEGAVAQMLK